MLLVTEDKVTYGIIPDSVSTEIVGTIVVEKQQGSYTYIL